MDTYLGAEEILQRAKRIESGEAPDGVDLARIIKTLTELEVEEGGPYRIVRGGDIDLGLNLAIARLLGALGIRLPKLDAYIASAIKTQRESRFFDDSELAELIAWRAPFQTRKDEPLDAEEERIMARIRALAEERFSALPVFVRKNAINAIERTIKGNIDKQMSLISLYTRQALGTRGARINDEHVALLGLANIFFWTAFIVYDDFWDEDEAANRNLLPIANLFARHYTDVFTHLDTDATFRDFFHTEMDELDAANAWEISMCRARVEEGVFHIPAQLPDYGDFSIKFHPAAGHIFGPIALLRECGYELSSPETSCIVDYFKHYLIAMQINDDMHDWKEDLARGHISTAVSVLLAMWKAKYLARFTITIEEDMSELEQLFWFECLKPLSEAALTHCERSRSALIRASCMEDIGPLEKYIRRNELIVDEALVAHTTSRDFLRVFS